MASAAPRRFALFDLAFLLVAASAVLMTGLTVWRQFIHPPQASASSSAAKDKTPVKVDNWDHLVATGHRFGATNPKTTLVIFGDFQCPACGAFETTALVGLRKKYPEDLAVVFHHWPLRYHQFAYAAARASECAADQGRFMEFHDAVYAKQDSLGKKSFASFAQESGVTDIDAFTKCATKHDSVAVINTGIIEASELGGKGTPTVVINGLRYPYTPTGAQIDSIIKTTVHGTK